MRCRVELRQRQQTALGRYAWRERVYLEDAATEFQVQGLELDWTRMVWDGDQRAHSLVQRCQAC